MVNLNYVVCFDNNHDLAARDHYRNTDQMKNDDDHSELDDCYCDDNLGVWSGRWSLIAFLANILSFVRKPPIVLIFNTNGDSISFNRLGSYSMFCLSNSFKRSRILRLRYSIFADSPTSLSVPRLIHAPNRMPATGINWNSFFQPQLSR